jgi:hypothetical protein
MNLLMLILIFLAVLVSGGVCYIAWRLSSDQPAGMPSKPAERDQTDAGKD